MSTILRVARVASLAKPYLKTVKGRAVTYYGPFPSEEAAERALWFSQSIQEAEAIWVKWGLSWRDRRKAGAVYFITDEEMKAFMAEPEGWDWSKVTVKPPKSVKAHPSWKEGYARVTDLERLWVYFSTGDIEALVDPRS